MELSGTFPLTGGADVGCGCLDASERIEPPNGFLLPLDERDANLPLGFDNQNGSEYPEDFLPAVDNADDTLEVPLPHNRFPELLIL